MRTSTFILFVATFLLFFSGKSAGPRRFVSILWIMLACSVFLLAPARAGDRSITVIQPFNNTACLVDSTNYSAAYDLDAYQPYDFKYALQLQVTNLITATGCVADVSYELSNNNVDYVASSNIVTRLSFTNSPTAGGKGFYQFDAGKSRYIRFKAIVTQTNAWISGWLAIQ